MTITSEDDGINEWTTNDKYDGRDYFKERPDAVGGNGYTLTQAFLEGIPGPIVQPANGSATGGAGGSRRRFVPSTAITVTAAAGTATATATAHPFLIGDIISTTDLATNVTNAYVTSVPTADTFTYLSGGTFTADPGFAVGVAQHGLVWFDDTGADTLYLQQFEGLAFGVNLTTMLIDRLVDVATISLTSTGLKDVNSVSLPRVTSGDGVEMFLELSSGISGGPPVVNARYTNSAGTGSRQGSSLTINSAAPVRSLIRLPYQGADQGARSVQQIEVETASTGGVATVILGKVYATLAVPSNNWNFIEPMARVEDAAVMDGRPCLFLAHVAGGTGSQTWMHYKIGMGWG